MYYARVGKSLVACMLLVTACACTGFMTACSSEPETESLALAPRPLAPNAVTPNPYLSSGDSVIHNDPYSSDVTAAVMPLGIEPVVTRAQEPMQSQPPSSALYDSKGNALTQLKGGISIADFDGKTINRLGRFSPAMGDDSVQYSLQTSYAMVDAHDNIVVPTSHGHVMILKTYDAAGNILPVFEPILDVDVVSAAQKALAQDGQMVDPRLLSVIYDYQGNLWFVTGGFMVDPHASADKFGRGFLGYLDRAYIEATLAGNPPDNVQDYLHFLLLDPGEGAENGISSNETGAVILTNKACYMLNAGQDGVVHVLWRTPYESNGWKAPVGGDYQGAGLAWGSGTTPTLTKDLVLFTDKRDPVHLIALDAKTGKEVVSVPVMELDEANPVSIENSILVYAADPQRASVILCNWYGAGNAHLADPEADSSVQTWANIYDPLWTQEGNAHIAPGVTRVDIIKQPDGSYKGETLWLRDDIRETSMMKLSTATGYLYGYWQVTGSNAWLYEMLDFETGETVFSYEVSTDPADNNMAVGLIPSPLGNGIYVPTSAENNQLICLRDTFVTLPSDSSARVPVNTLERSVIRDKDFQALSHSGLKPASYCMSACIEGLTADTALTFKVNGLTGKASDYQLYVKQNNGQFVVVDSSLWTLEAKGQLQESVVYDVNVHVPASTEKITIVLAH